VPAYATKQRIKNSVYRTIGTVGSHVGGGRRRSGLRVLLYHKVNDADGNPGSVPTGLFADHIGSLEGMGYRVVGLDEVVDYVRRGRALPANAVLITFDDGYRDNLENAAPVLSRLGYPAVVFVSVGHVGTERPMPHDERVAAENPLLDWDGLTEIEQHGVRVESHGIDHIALSRLSLDEARRQIVESRSTLEERLGRPVRAYAFVKGSRSDQGSQHVEMLASAGYALGFTTVTGSNGAGANPYLLRRYNVEPYPTRTLELVLSGACDAIALKDSELGTSARKAFNAVLRTSSR
jgi:peptidoglycan/xylan/chitin deacetylase (PgdA/CDA1 family)